jgi:ferric-dicitrate binding protein FerR (iron transport regulator)
MKEHELEALLQKYYNGETTLPEEKLLKMYLSKEGAFPQQKIEQQWFAQLQQEKELDTSKDFDKQLEEKFTEIRLDGEEKRTLRQFITWPYRVVALFTILIGLGFLAYFAFIRKQTQWVEITTAAKQTEEITLPDGSKVWLNGASTIRYAPQFETATVREVWLEGEAYFEVTHKPQQPFLVHSTGAVTQVLGTSFNIRAYPDEATVEVGVLSGKVNVALTANEQSQNLLLGPGNGALYDKKNASLHKKEIADPNLLSWKTHTLVFENAPLHVVVSSLERYFGVSIELVNPGLANCRFKGTFNQAKLQEILEVMEVSMSISTHHTGNQYSVSGKGCK